MRSIVAMCLCGLGLLAACGPSQPAVEEPAPPDQIVTPPVELSPAEAFAAEMAASEGAYTVEGQAMMDPEAGPMPFTGTHNQWVGEDGKLYMVYVQDPLEGMPSMQGWGTMYFDEEAGKVTMTWIDTMMPGFEMVATGDVGEDGAIRLDGMGASPTGEMVNHRMVLSFPEENVWELQVGVVGPDQNLVPMRTERGTRSGDPDRTWEPPAIEQPAPPQEAPPEEAPPEEAPVE